MPSPSLGPPLLSESWSPPLFWGIPLPPLLLEAGAAGAAGGVAAVGLGFGLVLAGGGAGALVVVGVVLCAAAFELELAGVEDDEPHPAMKAATIAAASVRRR